MTKTLQTIIH